MRLATVVVIAAAALGGRARAQCPSVCLPGGGPARTDCVIEWSGLPGMTASCVDGTGCDQDGVADGTCTFPLLACINVTGSADCTPGTLAGPPTVNPAKAPAAQALASALGALDPAGHGCTAPGIAALVGSPLIGQLAYCVVLFALTTACAVASWQLFEIEVFFWGTKIVSLIYQAVEKSRLRNIIITLAYITK